MRKKKEPEIVFLDGGKEPDYEKIRQLTQEEIDRHRKALEYKHDDWLDSALYSFKEWMEFKEKEKAMNDIKLTNVKLKKDERGYYLRLKYIEETNSAISEIIIPKLRLPIKTDDLIIKHETYITHEIEANIGFGYFPLEEGITEHSDGKKVLYTVKELKKKVHKMTVADIEKKLGYKIEIVSEEKDD